MSLSLTILCWSDIHHHPYTNGLTEEDTFSCEEQVSALAGLNADMLLFCGDMFLSKNPPDSVRHRADLALRIKNDLNIPVAYLLGNHDRWSKDAHAGHVLVGARDTWSDVLPNVTIMDERKSYLIKANGKVVEILACPADHVIDPKTFVPQHPAHFRIAAFHNIVKGCRLQNGMPAQDGMESATLDLPYLDAVIGGDNHTHQDLGFKNTLGLYVGAPLQHNWGDTGQERGFVIVKITKDDHNVITQRGFTHISSTAPKFIEMSITIKKVSDLESMLTELHKQMAGNIVKVKISGPIELLNTINIPETEDRTRRASGARLVRLIPDPDDVVTTNTLQVANTNAPIQDFEALIDSGKTDISGYEKVRLMKMADEFLQMAKC